MLFHSRSWICGYVLHFRHRGARIEDPVQAIKQLHDDFQWPLPILTHSAFYRTLRSESRETSFNGMSAFTLTVTHIINYCYPWYYEECRSVISSCNLLLLLKSPWLSVEYSYMPATQPKTSTRREDINDGDLGDSQSTKDIILSPIAFELGKGVSLVSHTSGVRCQHLIKIIE